MFKTFVLNMGLANLCHVERLRNISRWKYQPRKILLNEEILRLVPQNDKPLVASRIGRSEISPRFFFRYTQNGKKESQGYVLFKR